MRASGGSTSKQAHHGGKSLQIDVAIVALLLVGLGVKFPLPPDIAALNGSTVFAIYLLGKHALRWFNASFSLKLIAEYKVLHPTSSGFDG